MYNIPKEVLRKFHHVSARNRLENGKHIETLAFLFGYKSESNFIGTHLIFPEQEGTCSRVDDKGKFFCILSTLCPTDIGPTNIRTWEPGPVLGNLDPYSGTSTYINP